MREIEAVQERLSTFSHKFKNKLELYKVLRILEQTSEIDDDEYQGALSKLVVAIHHLTQRDRGSIKEFKNCKKQVIHLLKKNHGELLSTSMSSIGYPNAAASTPGSIQSSSSGVIGAAVMYGSNQRFDDDQTNNKQ